LVVEVQAAHTMDSVTIMAVLVEAVADLATMLDHTVLPQLDTAPAVACRLMLDKTDNLQHVAVLVAQTQAVVVVVDNTVLTAGLA
jgi:hypothetical protein